jgi:hypothetical protein
VYNIKKAVSRLDFAPRIEEIRVTDIKQGLGVFTPRPNKAVSFSALRASLKKAGYTLASAEITVAGSLSRDPSGIWIEADSSKQRFTLEGGSDQVLRGIDAGAHVEVTGDWQTIGQDADAREVIRPRIASVIGPSKSANAGGTGEQRTSGESIQVSLGGLGIGSGLYRAPIRTTSPGLTVYKGGAVTPRFYFIRQHLGSLEVNRQALRVGVSYTPTPTLQLEAEIPYQRTSFEDGTLSGSGNGLGNIVVLGKYRFYRELETWGDRQAAVRFGLELPTGKKSAPGEDKLAAPDFVRQQLSAINGGLAFHADVSYSKAHRRLIYGANIEGTLRGERDGFRTGHEVRLNTDLEYVLLPLKYQSPGRELFAILETSYSYRNRGRVGGRIVPGSSSSEFYLAPALQFTASPRLVLEMSLQFPVVLNSGPLVLRTDQNLLVGIRYLY